MVEKIQLNDTWIQLVNFKAETENDQHKITIDFRVSHEDYHDIATLLYEGVFDVKVPEDNLAFRGKIAEYSTSITNLYNEGEVGAYHIVLLEVERS